MSLVTAASPIDPEPEPDEPTPEPEEPAQLIAARERHPAQRAPRPAAPARPSTLYGVARELCDAVRAAGPGAALQTVTPMVDRLNALSLQAALTDVVTPSGTSGVAGLVRPDYQNEVLGLIEYGAPVVAAFQQGNLDSNPVIYPKWTTLPTVEVQATQKTQIGTGPVRIDPATVEVVTFAGGNNVAMQVVDWSSPDFIAEYFRACAEVYAREIEDAFVATLVAGVTELEQTGTLAAAIGEAIGAVAATGLPPDRIIVAGDILGDLWAANVGIISGGISQVMNIDLPVPRVVVSPRLTAGTAIVTSSKVMKSWQNRGAPVQLRAVNVGLLGVDLGVYGYFAWAIVHGATTANPAIISVVNETP